MTTTYDNEGDEIRPLIGMCDDCGQGGVVYELPGFGFYHAAADCPNTAAEVAEQERRYGSHEVFADDACEGCGTHWGVWSRWVDAGSHYESRFECNDCAAERRASEMVTR